MAINNLTSTINTTNNNTFMTLKILTNIQASPTTTRNRTFQTTTNRLIITMTNIINRQPPILIIQNSPIQTQTPFKRFIHNNQNYISKVFLHLRQTFQTSERLSSSSLQAQITQNSAPRILSTRSQNASSCSSIM